MPLRAACSRYHSYHRCVIPRSPHPGPARCWPCTPSDMDLGIAAHAGSDISAATASVDAGRLTTDTPVGTTPSCSLRFRLSGMPRDAAVICTGWACEFTVNTTRAYCPLIRCECPKGCSNGKPVALHAAEGIAYESHPSGSGHVCGACALGSAPL